MEIQQSTWRVSSKKSSKASSKDNEFYKLKDIQPVDNKYQVYPIRLTKSEESIATVDTSQGVPRVTKTNDKVRVRQTKSVDRDPPKKQLDGSVGNGRQLSKFDCTPKPVFDPNDEIYMANACCECMHYRTASAVVAILEIIFIFVWSAIVIYYYAVNGLSDFSNVIIACQLIIGLIIVLSIVSLLFGVFIEKRLLLYPHMLIQLMGIAVSLILTVLSVLVMAYGNSLPDTVFGFLFGHNNIPYVEENFGPIWPFCLACIFDFKAAIGIWFYVVVKGYYDYLLDKELFERLRCQNTFRQADYSRMKVVQKILT